MDAFSCPSLKKSQQKTSKQLREARDYIDEMKNSYHSLETKFTEREAYFNKRESEMQENHKIELSKGMQNNFIVFINFFFFFKNLKTFLNNSKTYTLTHSQKDFSQEKSRPVI